MLRRHLSLKSCLILLLGFCLSLMVGCSTKKPPEKKFVIKYQQNNNADKLKTATRKSDVIWLLVDTKTKQLEVKRGEKTLATFHNIAIGSNGAGFKNRRGDKITPLGTYKIGWINHQSTFRTFYGFTYPSVENAKTALKKGLVSESDYHAILDAHQNNQTPPQHTSLGGMIGLHGLGSGNEEVHELFDWTRGCVAVNNEQIDELSQWLTKGIEITVK